MYVPSFGTVHPLWGFPVIYNAMRYNMWGRCVWLQWKRCGSELLRKGARTSDNVPFIHGQCYFCLARFVGFRSTKPTIWSRSKVAADQMSTRIRISPNGRVGQERSDRLDENAFLFIFFLLKTNCSVCTSLCVVSLTSASIKIVTRALSPRQSDVSKSHFSMRFCAWEMLREIVWTIYETLVIGRWKSSG